MQFFSGISSNIKAIDMLSLTECVWDFQNNALWDTHQHALLKLYSNIGLKFSVMFGFTAREHKK